MAFGPMASRKNIASGRKTQILRTFSPLNHKKMQTTIDALQKIVANYSKRLTALSPETYAFKPDPKKWSKKQILGHLVDSAQNNIRRFIVAQYEDTPSIGYDQDQWVRLSGYQDYDTADLVQLWILLNRHLMTILGQIPPDAAKRKSIMGGPPQTLLWIAADYCNHLLHHLHQILDLDPIAYP
jgi:hypothetical protein